MLALSRGDATLPARVISDSKNRIGMGFGVAVIKAVVFDLDGVLVQTEKLKALSYARAVQQIRGLKEPDPAAIEAYRETVGAPREAAARHIIDKLGLEGELRPLMGQYGASQAWEALSSIRLSVYSKIVSDPKVIRENRWPHTVALLGFIRRAGCRIGLATMSPRLTAERILRILRVYSVFWVLVTAEDVKKGKPDPEVYLVAAAKLDVAPPECLVLEDSVNGVEAAIAAGAHVIAIATPFTECALRSDEELKRKGDVPVVRSSGDVAGTVRRRIEELNAGGGRLAGACPL